MPYSLSHSFRVDAAGKPIPLHDITAAARHYADRNYPETEHCCRQILKQAPGDFDALHLLGVVHLDQSQLPDAIDCLTRAVQARPADAQVHYHLGNALLADKQHDLAATQFRQTLTLAPNHADALNNLGNTLAAQHNYGDAIDCFRRALQLRPASSPSLYNLGRSLAALDRSEEAIDSFRAALASDLTGAAPNRIADIYAALGQALVGLGRYDEALTTCQAMSHLNSGTAAWNASLVLLLLGQFAEGWRLYQGRWAVPDHDAPHPAARIPTLAEVTGQRVLLLCEQGHGDMIQFARYAPMLARQGATVTLQTYIELQALMQTMDGLAAVITDKDSEPPADIITPLLSLPVTFNTDLASIPADVPYLHAPTDRLEIWRQRLGPRVRPRVGLCWWGSQHIPKRSLPLDRLAPLLQHSDIEFHALQKEPPQRHPSMIDHSADLQDFADTAALIMQLDLVISIDTSVAHLAGALGKPVWILLQFSADWRWLLDRSDSPWYPTARLFRQKLRGDWDGVVDDVAQALAAWSGRFQNQFEGDANRIVAADQPALTHPAGRIDDEHI
jgi:tetratricopeptide (TPR) repeat protein